MGVVEREAMQIEGILYYEFFRTDLCGRIFHFSKRQRQLKRRENSLRYDSTTNTYNWIGLMGPQMAIMHPAEPGGDWYEANQSGGIHNGGGGYGGGDIGGRDSSAGGN